MTIVTWEEAGTRGQDGKEDSGSHTHTHTHTLMIPRAAQLNETLDAASLPRLARPSLVPSKQTLQEQTHYQPTLTRRRCEEAGT